MQTWKLAEAARDIFMQEQKWLGMNENLEETINVSTRHIQTMFAFIREAKYEELVNPGGKYLRTGGIRKRLAMAGYSDLLQETLAGLHTKSPDERSLSPASTVLYEEEEQQWPGCFSPDPKQQEAMAIGIDQEEEQWPSCFAPQDPARRCAEGVSDVPYLANARSSQEGCAAAGLHEHETEAVHGSGSEGHWLQ